MIRKIVPGDRALFARLAGEFYASDAVLHSIPKEYIERTFDELARSDEYLEGYLFEVNGETAGYALVSKSFSPEVGGRVAWIEELFVLGSFRGRGIGNEFFDKLPELCPAARYRLEIEPGNKKAERLYIKRGFEPLGYAQLVKDAEDGAKR